MRKCTSQVSRKVPLYVIGRNTCFMDDLTPPAFTFCRSSTFAAPALGSLILEHDAHLSTYSPVIVPEGTLVEWIRNGNRFVQDHSIPMTVVGMEGNLKGINNTLDYLYRDSTDPVIKLRPVLNCLLRLL